MDITEAWLEIAELNEPNQPFTKLELEPFQRPGEKQPDKVRFVVISDTHSAETRYPGRL